MVAILQPIIPHYRQFFFQAIYKKFKTDIFCFDEEKLVKNQNFKKSNIESKNIRSISVGPFLFYDFFKLFKNDYKVLVLMLNFGHISTWILLFTKRLHKKKIILMGHGISVKRYLKEEKKPSLLLKWMVGLSDCIWTYTEKEMKQWKSVFPEKKLISLNNTVSNVEEILSYKGDESKNQLKEKFGITQEICFIFCARFNNIHRRIDILIQLIDKLDSSKFGFIIIGDGSLKPDFKKYKNVYDFGEVYDFKLKSDLFSMADLYFQPGWVGLSVVEALAYGKPVLTFYRSKEILQCVEYYYLINGINSLIFESVVEFKNKVDEIKTKQILELGDNAKEYVNTHLSMDNMVNNAINSITNLIED